MAREDPRNRFPARRRCRRRRRAHTRAPAHSLTARARPADAGYVPQIIVFQALMVLVAGRRNGGAYKTLTTADTTALSSMLPRDYETSTRNMVGLQMSGWGAAAVFFPAVTFNLLGLAANPLMSAMMTAIGLTNLVLGGKVLGGTDDAAAANAVVFNGGWAVLLALGRTAGVFSGTYVPVITVFNGAFALWCASKLV